jgi:hypothetical protein
MKNYNFHIFLDLLSEWVDSFNISGGSGQFSVKMGSQKPSLYGICDMVFNLSITNEFDGYVESHHNEAKEEWIKTIKSYQNPKTGWFKEGLINYGMHFKEHSSAFSVSALKLLGAQPDYEFKIAKKLNTKKKVENWLKKTPEWALLYWPGSHRGGGVAAIFATLGSKYYPNEKFFEWYFDWLDKKADPEVGFWRLGWIHKLKKNRLTINELGGAVHYYWIYEFFNHSIPYPKKIIDSTLFLQNKLGTWHKNYSYCIDLDAIFCLTRCSKQADSYRKDDIKAAIIKYLEFIIKRMNNKDFLYEYYRSAHTLTGYVCAIAEIYKFYPELLDLPRPWIQTLDLTPWI